MKMKSAVLDMRISEALGQENLGLGVEGADSLDGDRNLLD